MFTGLLFLFGCSGEKESTKGSQKVISETKEKEVKEKEVVIELPSFQTMEEADTYLFENVNPSNDFEQVMPMLSKDSDVTAADLEELYQAKEKAKNEGKDYQIFIGGSVMPSKDKICRTVMPSDYDDKLYCSYWEFVENTYKLKSLEVEEIYDKNADDENIDETSIETNTNELISDDAIEVGRRLTEAVTQFKEYLGSDESTINDFRESLSDIEKIALDSESMNISDEERKIMMEWKKLSVESVFNKEGVTDSDVEEWFNQYNDLLERTSKLYRNMVGDKMMTNFK
jgi:hypothetical protein